MKTKTKYDEAKALAGVARSWPKISELEKETGVPGRTIRQAIATGEITATNLDVYRVDPESFAVWFLRRQP